MVVTHRAQTSEERVLSSIREGESGTVVELLRAAHLTMAVLTS